MLGLFLQRVRSLTRNLNLMVLSLRMMSINLFFILISGSRLDTSRIFNTDDFDFRGIGLNKKDIFEYYCVKKEMRRRTGRSTQLDGVQQLISKKVSSGKRL